VKESIMPASKAVLASVGARHAATKKAIADGKAKGAAAKLKADASRFQPSKPAPATPQ